MRSTPRPAKNNRPKKKPFRKAHKGSDPHQDWLYGRHAVLAALENPQRHIFVLHGTSNAAKDFDSPAKARDLTLSPATTSEISALLPDGAVHQGIAAKVRPLAETGLKDLPTDRPVIVLDQVTDPHNVGAILRSAAVFNASALIMTRRNSPPLTGVLAKSACGALEHVHAIYVGNLAQALKDLADHGFWRIGLAGEAEKSLDEAILFKGPNRPVALVLGAEDKGLRRLTKEQCDDICHIPTKGKLTSLNVSNAAAIALHVVSKSTVS